MSPTTRIDQALERVDAERSWTVEKRDEFDAFVATVEAAEPAQSAVVTSGAGAGGGGRASNPAGHGAPAPGPLSNVAGATAASTTASGGASTAQVLAAFDEHLSEYSGAPGASPTSVHECVAEEFSTDLAVALCGGDTAGVLTPALKAAVLEEARSRRAELDAMVGALEREHDSLAGARDAVAPVVDWFVEHDPTPLSDLGFERLRSWHERVEEHRSALDRVASERQAAVRTTTSVAGAVGVEHATLLEYLYADFEPTHPVLATVATLADCCREAQRAIRDHLIRRV